MALINYVEKKASLNSSKKNAIADISSVTSESVANEKKKLEINTEILTCNVSEDFLIQCYTCDTAVCGKNILDHLYFGRLDCKHCSVKIGSCERFREIYHSSTMVCKNNQSGKHEFSKWHAIAIDYLSYFLRKELVIERFCQNKKGALTSDDVLIVVSRYISNLSVLESHLPWKEMIKYCLEHFKTIGIKYSEEQLKTEKVPLRSNQVKDHSEASKVSHIGSYHENSSESLDKDDPEATEQSKVLEQNNIVSQEIESSKDIDSKTSQCSSEKQVVSDTIKESVNDCSSQLCKVSKHNDGGLIECDDCNPSNENRTNSIQLPQQEQSSKVTDTSCKEVFLQKELSIHDPDDPDEGLLQTFNIERLDQAVEYVTIEDDRREKGNTQISEVPNNLFKDYDQQQSSEDNNTCILYRKRKVSGSNMSSVSKISSKCLKTHSQNIEVDFKPPDQIANGHYLVIHFPTQGCPEECPNCYCEFCPSMLTVNCTTFVSTIICADCNLTIYVLPD